MGEDIIIQFGYAGLFLASFVAATLVPMGSEAAVALMAATGYSPVMVLAVATTGNSLGAVLNYYVGKWGRNFILSRYIKTESPALERADATFERWGSPVLFFAWLPIVGDPLTVMAGVLRVHLTVFLFWVILGKGLRYFLILLGVDFGIG